MMRQRHASLSRCSMGETGGATSGGGSLAGAKAGSSASAASAARRPQVPDRITAPSG